MDEYALQCFEALGLKEEDIPKKTVDLYRRVKSARDKLSPGRLDVDTIALIYAFTVPVKPATPPPPTPPKE